MRVGMLWYDDSNSQTLEEKVAGAVAHYQAKYGVSPDTCHCHPSMLIGQPDVINGVAMHPSNAVLPNHLWIGLDKQESTPERIEGNDQELS